MKTIKGILMVSALFISYSSFSQVSGKELHKKERKLKTQKIQQIIENRNFVFKANSLTTNTGFHKMLDSEYDFTVKNDSAIAYLPFWGTLYMSKTTEEGGLKFEKSLFEYQYKDKGKKGHQIFFKIKKDGDSYHIHFDISQEGYSNLTISSTRRSFISFYGQIEPLQRK